MGANARRRKRLKEMIRVSRHGARPPEPKKKKGKVYHAKPDAPHGPDD